MLVSVVGKKGEPLAVLIKRLFDVVHTPQLTAKRVGNQWEVSYILGRSNGNGQDSTT